MEHGTGMRMRGAVQPQAKSGALDEENPVLPTVFETLYTETCVFTPCGNKIKELVEKKVWMTQKKCAVTSYQYDDYGRMTSTFLAFDVKDAKRILIEDGVYDSHARKQLSDYIKAYTNDTTTKISKSNPKLTFKEIFSKKSKYNKKSSKCGAGK